ncbi:hypothetical protein PTSG_12055 [Salpingoeca rosetta]|uniref:WW domain-containing protein n=1 Tax=Salpingoeca rosetta (strain ATCC 50818 / BSB-021) TaxID=946362 RepID=F2U681_SALR5|nr:uncharacterized protein PTSG_12055 [Salpingoeca rosetta]EGD83022.1 hypothetical protein PTSG_12055 [Salpingoeca rosetta]|eukprot:XP_004995386.1 hypothetical protein PTSG_12055 [Salpingoeca rosetta]
MSEVEDAYGGVYEDVLESDSDTDSDASLDELPAEWPPAYARTETGEGSDSDTQDAETRTPQQEEEDGPVAEEVKASAQGKNDEAVLASKVVGRDDAANASGQAVREGDDDASTKATGASNTDTDTAEDSKEQVNADDAQDAEAGGDAVDPSSKWKDILARCRALGLPTEANVSEYDRTLIHCTLRMQDHKTGATTKTAVVRSLKDMEGVLKQVEDHYSPAGWTLVWCEDLSRHYYINKDTGATSWEVPSSSTQASTDGSSQPAAKRSKRADVAVMPRSRRSAKKLASIFKQWQSS